MALGFKIADGYVEVHADYDRSELRRAAQQAADAFDDTWDQERDRDLGDEGERGERAGRDFGDSFGREGSREATISFNKDFRKNFADNFDRDGRVKSIVAQKMVHGIITKMQDEVHRQNAAFDRTGRSFAQRLGSGIKRGLHEVNYVDTRLKRRLASHFGRAGDGAAASFLKRFVEVVTFGQADFARAMPRSAFAAKMAGLGTALGGALAATLVLQVANAITALSPLLLGFFAAFPIFSLIKTGVKKEDGKWVFQANQMGRALKKLKGEFQSFMRVIRAPLKAPVFEMIKDAAVTLRKAGPPMAAFFKGIGSGLTSLARGAGGMVIAFFKNLQAAIPGVRAGLRQWGIELPKIGAAIGKMFSTILKNPALVQRAVQGLSNTLQFLLGVAGHLVTGLTYLAAAIGNLWRVANVGEGIIANLLSGLPGLDRLRQAFLPLGQAIRAAWEAFKSFATAMSGQEATQRLITLVQRIKDIWGPLKTFIGEVWRMAWAKIKEIWNTYVVPWLTGTVEPWLKQKLREIIKFAIAAMKEEAGSSFRSFVSSIPGMLAGLVGKITKPFTDAAKAAGRKAREIVTSAVNWLKQLPGKAASAISSLWSRMQGAFTRAVTGARQKATELVNQVVSFLRGLPGKAASAVSRLWGSMVGAFSSAVSNARAAANRLVSGFISSLRTIIGKARSAASSAKSAIVGVFSGAGSWLASAGRNIASGLANGIRGGLSWVTSAARSLASAAKAAAMSALGISSPSKVFAEEVGVPAAQGIAVGLRKRFPEEMMDLRKSLPQIRMPEAAMAGAGAAGHGGGFSPTINVNVAPGFYDGNAAAKRALTKDVFLALEAYRKDYER